MNYYGWKRSLPGMTDLELFGELTRAENSLIDNLDADEEQRELDAIKEIQGEFVSRGFSGDWADLIELGNALAREEHAAFRRKLEAMNGSAMRTSPDGYGPLH